MTTSLAHLEKICVEIGPRPIGSRGNLAAADYIAGVFRAAGLDVSEERFACPDWQSRGAALECNSTTLPAVANVFSPACEVTASLAAASTVAELAAADIAGRVAVLYGDLSKEPLIPKNCLLYNTERDQTIIRLLEEKQPAALIMVRLPPHNLTGLIEDWNMPFPSVTVPAESGLDLLQHLGQPAHVKIEAQVTPSYSANIVGYQAGRRAEHIVLCAHYDTKVDTPGALDNGAGVAVLLSLAEQFAHRRLDAGLEFVAFTGEEYSNGEADTEYVRLKGEEFGRILTAINLDGIGYALGANTITLLSHSPAFQAEVAALVAKRPGLIWVEPWPQSNHSTFAWRGVPAIALSSIGAFERAHLPCDTLDWVSVEKLNEVIDTVTEIVESVQAQPLTWFRPRAEN